MESEIQILFITIQTMKDIKFSMKAARYILLLWDHRYNKQYNKKCLHRGYFMESLFVGYKNTVKFQISPRHVVVKFYDCHKVTTSARQNSFYQPQFSIISLSGSSKVGLKLFCYLKILTHELQGRNFAKDRFCSDW